MNRTTAIACQRQSTRFLLSAAILLGTPLLGSAAANAADLVQVYEQAREYDAQFAAAKHDLESARRLLPIARSSLRPQLNFGGEVGLSTLADDGEGPYEETSLSLSLSQTLINRSSSKIAEQAETTVRQAEAQYAAAGQALILRVATAYFDVLRAHANVEFSQSELEAISRQLEQAERRFDVGLVPITDVRSAQAQYDLAVAQEIASDNQLSTAREALLVISGTDPEKLSLLAEDMPLLPPSPADINAWVETARDQNLGLLVARLNQERSATQVQIERATRYPTLELVGTAVSSTSEQSNIGDRDVGSIGLRLNLPLLSGGRINALVAQAKAEELSAGQALLAQERATTQQARDGYRGVAASISRAKALRRALESTQKSAEATEAGFRAGTRTSVEVLQALRDTYSARSDYAGARYDYIINSLTLKAAAGTLSETDLAAVNRFLADPDTRQD